MNFYLLQHCSSFVFLDFAYPLIQNNMHLSRLLLLYILILSACSGVQRTEEQQAINDLPDATWRAVMAPNDSTEIPFVLKTSHNMDGQLQFTLVNGEEELILDEYEFKEDSLIISLLSFDTDLRLKVEDDKLIGTHARYWYDQPYVIPITCYKDDERRFILNKPEPIANISGTWDVEFLNEEGEPDKAVGVFEQKGLNVTGTFLTPTGDYRYLAGVVDGNMLKLSCFDGSHLFLFKAEIDSKKKLTNGTFHSGSHWYQPWVGMKDADAQLPDAGELTFIKDDYDKLAFKFPDLDSNMVSLSDEKYQGKVVVVQLMGSWCPNCMDETKFFNSMYDKYHDDGLEIIGLAYERKTDFDYSKAKVSKMQGRLSIPYDILIAGTFDKKEAAKTLPMLNHIISFPTALVIDRKGEVAYIHTGFSGPGTGKYYTQFVDEFTALVQGLLAEQS
jgi:thiol-disulfide isomerase/thioredoxin